MPHTSPFRSLRVCYCIGKLRFSGGVKVLFQHVRILRSLGCDASLFTKSYSGLEELYGIKAQMVERFDHKSLGNPQIVVATVPEDVKEVWKEFSRRDTRVVHLIQGMYLANIDYDIREFKNIPKYRDSWIRYLLKRRHYEKKRKSVASLYRLDTIKVAVSETIKEEVESTTRKECHLVPNGVDRTIFYPRGKPMSFEPENTVRILSTGPATVKIKAIEDVLSAVRILKSKGLKVGLTRVSYTPETEEEKRTGVVDEYLENLTEEEMAEVYINSHILMLPSVEGEGFSLPPVEAMSCGLPCILTKIDTHLAYDRIRDYAYFVPPHSPAAMAEAVEKIIGDEALRKGLIKGGFRVAERYSLEETGRRLDDLFRRLIDADTR